MKNLQKILIIIGLLVWVVGYVFSRSMNESEGGLFLLLALVIGALFIIFGLALIIAKIVSDKNNEIKWIDLFIPSLELFLFFACFYFCTAFTTITQLVLGPTEPLFL